MVLFGLTRDELVERICRLGIGEYWQGTTNATGTNKTAKDSVNRQEADDFFNNKECWIYIRTGTYKTGERLISDFDNTDGVITWVLALGGTIASGVKYSIHSKWRRLTIHEAINQAIDMATEHGHLVDKIDETSISLAAGAYEYAIPSGFTHIYRLTMEDGNGEFYDMVIPPDQYKIIRSSVIPKIHFYSDTVHPEFGDGHSVGSWWANIDFTATRHIRIEGYGVHPYLKTDEETCTISPNFIVAQASALLHLGKVTGNDPDIHATRYNMQQGKADGLRRAVRTNLPPNCKRVQ